MTWLRRLLEAVRSWIDSTFTHGVSEPPNDDEGQPPQA